MAVSFTRQVRNLLKLIQENLIQLLGTIATTIILLDPLLVIFHHHMCPLHLD